MISCKSKHLLGVHCTILGMIFGNIYELGVSLYLKGTILVH